MKIDACVFIFIFCLDVIVFVLRKNEVDGVVDDDVVFGNMYLTNRQESFDDDSKR